MEQALSMQPALRDHCGWCTLKTSDSHRFLVDSSWKEGCTAYLRLLSTRSLLCNGRPSCLLHAVLHHSNTECHLIGTLLGFLRDGPFTRYAMPPNFMRRLYRTSCINSDLTVCFIYPRCSPPSLFLLTMVIWRRSQSTVSLFDI